MLRITTGMREPGAACGHARAATHHPGPGTALRTRPGTGCHRGSADHGARVSLDRRATYIAAAYIAGAAR